MSEPGAMALSPGGHLYIVDHAASLVLRKGPEDEGLIAFASNPEMSALSDIAIEPGGQRLYVADRDRGVLVIDLENQVSAMLTGPETLNLGGIGSLFFWDNKLVIIPNGQVAGDTITNYTSLDKRRVDLVIGVSYDDDLKLARRVLVSSRCSQYPMADDRATE